MRTVKRPIFTASLTFLLFLTGCKEFFADIEKDFSHWTSMAFIIDTVLGTIQIDNEGYPCLPAPASGSAGKDIILNLHNPRGYTFIMPNASGAPSDIIVFESGVTGSTGSGSPVYGTDYTMTQISPAEIKLSFTGNFLRYSQNGRQNLSPTISLYNTDGRKFDSYTFKLRCNTAPHIFLNASDVKIGKTTGSAPCYVFCFKHLFADQIWQQDVNALCFKVDGTEYVRTFSVSSAGAVSPDSGSATGVYALVPLSGVVALQPADMPSGAGSPDTLPNGPDIICLKTDVPVVSGGGVKKSFTLWLRDKKGLVSHKREKSTYALKLPSPRIFADSALNTVLDSGVYTKSGTTGAAGNNDVNGGLPTADGSTEARAIPVYSAYGTDVKLIVNKDPLQNYPEGAVIKGRVSRVSGTTANPSFNEGIGGTSGTPAQISLPAPGETVYKSETWAEGAVFDTSDVRTLYYRVVKAVSSDTDSTVPVWGILKKAVEEKTAPDGTVIIDGEIKATNAAGNSGEIVIDKKLTIKKADGASSAVLNANKADTGKPKHRIFNVKANAHFDLDGLTLVGGQTSSGDPHGGAILMAEANITSTIKKCIIGQTGNSNIASQQGGGIYLNIAGGSLTLEDTQINSCTADGGGGIYLQSGNLIFEGVQMKNNTANNGKGRAVWVEDGSFKIKDSSTTKTYLDPTTTSSKNPDDVYLADGKTITVNGTLTGIPAGSFTSPQAARITPQNYTAGTQVVEAENGVSIGDVTNKFTVTPQTAPSKNWIIDKKGRLRDFDGIDKDVIAAFDGNMNTTTIKKYNEMIGHFIFYKTSSGNYGVMIITETPLYAADAYEMKFSYKTYDASGSVLKEGEETVTGTYSFDLDTGTTGNALSPGVDFFLHNSINIVPKNNARFFTQNPPQ